MDLLEYQARDLFERFAVPLLSWHDDVSTSSPAAPLKRSFGPRALTLATAAFSPAALLARSAL